jgi:uncharacterized membrane protein
MKRTSSSNGAGGQRMSILGQGLLTGALLLLGAGAVLAFSIPGLAKGTMIKPESGMVTIPLGKVANGKAHFFYLPDGRKNIVFFVVKANDGSYRAAFDSCDVCFKEKKGYVQQGDYMVCKNCNQRFATNRIGPHAVGGCNPSYLASSIEGTNIVIRTADLQAGARYF